MSHSPAVAEWDNDYARVARFAAQLRTQGLTNTTLSSSSYYSDTPQPQLQHHLSRLEGALATLPLTSGEIQRRRRLIHHLRGGTISTTSPSPFYSARIPRSMSGSEAGASSYVDINQPHESQMAAAMRQQDEMIDDLAVGVSRLKDQTQVIGDEARMHVNLLGEMETNLQAAQCGLDEETKRAAKLKEDQSVWRLQLIVAGEVVLFVMLLFLGLSP